jgi:hypothetical protein
MKTNSFRWNRLAFLALIPILLCVALATFGPGLVSALRQNMWQHDPAQAAKIAHAMVDYSLPTGYQEKAYFQIMESSNVIIAPVNGSDGMTILLLQESMALNDQEIVTQMEEAWAKQVGAHTYQTERTHRETAILRGKGTTLSYRAGTDENGTDVRQLVTVFYGKTGWTVLVIVSPLADWNQSLVDEFLSSLK